jgi:hypothetical protein
LFPKQFITSLASQTKSQKNYLKKRYKIFKSKNENKQREKYLLKKYRFSFFDSGPFPILARKNARG